MASIKKINCPNGFECFLHLDLQFQNNIICNEIETLKETKKCANYCVIIIINNINDNNNNNNNDNDDDIIITTLLHSLKLT